MATVYQYDLQSKLERAIAAYLISKQCGTLADILTSESTVERTLPNTTITAGIASEEVMNSGIFRLPVFMTVQGSATKDPNDASEDTPRVKFTKRVAMTGDYLNMTDGDGTLRATALDITTAGRALAVDASGGADPDQVQFAADNADMAQFTVLGWFVKGFGKPEAKDESAAWAVVLIFEAICVPAAIN